jgi:hypothetical protein
VAVGEIAEQEGLSGLAAEGDKDGPKRQYSTIQFPYGDLDDAVAVARAVHNVGGSRCEINQLAAELGHATSEGGAFRTKLAVARVFGLIATAKDSVRLTERGRDIVDPSYEQGARVEAFLAVPLFNEIYERYKRTMLPRDIALERELEGLGVPSKQKERARQIFQRSAGQAGFFKYGKDRLVRPAVASASSSEPDGSTASTPPPKSEEAIIVPPRRLRGVDDEPPVELLNVHPAIRGMLITLPAPGSRWPKKKQESWLGSIQGIFDLIYTDVEG